MLDDHAWVRPFVEFYRDEGFAWAQTGAKYSWSGQIDEAEIQQAVAEYAVEGARPSCWPVRLHHAEKREASRDTPTPDPSPQAGGRQPSPPSPLQDPAIARA